MLDPDYALFARVVAAGSLSAAARDMGISPAMASKRMARLEARLGARLIHRTTRRLALTEQGEGFHRDVLGILAAVEAAEGRLRGPGDGLSGPLRLSAPTSFGRMHLAPHLKPFLDRHPGIELTLDLSDGFSDLIAEKIDLAIRISSGVGPGWMRNLWRPAAASCAPPRPIWRRTARRRSAQPVRTIAFWRPGASCHGG
jgi:DNA-binding transcriptional LysR family regulator